MERWLLEEIRYQNTIRSMKSAGFPKDQIVSYINERADRLENRLIREGANLSTVRTTGGRVVLRNGAED